MKKIAIPITILFVLSILFSVWLYREVCSPFKAGLSSTVVFSIEKGEGAKEIADNLKKEKLIGSSFVFRIYVFITQKGGKLKAGQYELSENMNIVEISDKMASGDVIKNLLTIVEGWNLKDIAELLDKEKLFSKQDFLESVNPPFVVENIYDKFEFLKDKPEDLSLEGYFFPDTYEVSPDTIIKDFVEKALSNFNEKLNPDLRYEIIKKKKTIFDIITMASLIEKEVRGVEDKKIVSGILWKRLENNMPLQVDATVLYIIGSTKLSIADTKIDSPYNTYQYKGLPSGPICNPGIESIEAAIYPESSPYWYYLSAPDGTTIFSKTFEEHKKAKEKYLE